MFGEQLTLFDTLHAHAADHGVPVEDMIDNAAEIHPAYGLADLVHADLHLRPQRDSEHTYCSGTIGTNATTRPVSVSKEESLLSLHQREFVALKDPDGRAWRLKVCQKCLAAAYVDAVTVKTIPQTIGGAL